ncbi:MAG: sensory rhodopsin transducer [Nitrospirota bacterium]
MKIIGRTTWAIPGGRIPLNSTGPEPDFTSNEELCILNAGYQDAKVEITVFYESRDPVGPYRITVPAKRTRHVRFNDLIAPEAMPLDTDYACIVDSDVAIVVQFNRRDTSRAENALMGVMAFPVD